MRFFPCTPCLLPLLPLPVPLRFYVGSPIEPALAAPCANPSEEQIDALHAVYMAALTKLFDEHKREAGYPEAELKIV